MAACMHPCSGEDLVDARQRRRRHTPHHLQPEETVKKRNARERMRIQTLNDAFLDLKKHVRCTLRDQRASKETVLRAAIGYIHKLSDMIREHDKNKAAPQRLKENLAVSSAQRLATCCETPGDINPRSKAHRTPVSDNGCVSATKKNLQSFVEHHKTATYEYNQFSKDPLTAFKIQVMPGSGHSFYLDTQVFATCDKNLPTQDLTKRACMYHNFQQDKFKELQPNSLEPSSKSTKITYNNRGNVLLQNISISCEERTLKHNGYTPISGPENFSYSPKYNFNGQLSSEMFCHQSAPLPSHPYMFSPMSRTDGVSSPLSVQSPLATGMCQ